MKKFTTFSLLMALAVSLSACGGGDKATEAPADQKQSQSTATSGGGADVQKIIQQKNCTSCHGQNLQGASGPALNNVGSRLSKDEIKQIIKEGRGGMPPGLIKDEQELEAVATYLSEQK